MNEPGDIYYYYDAPNHRFIVEYFRVSHYPAGNPENFEIILYDPAYYPTPTGDGEIVIQYLTDMSQFDNTIGIENASETVGIQYYCDYVYHNLGVPVTDSFALKFTTESPMWGIADFNKHALPTMTVLHAPYPNPFHHFTDLRYQITDNRQKSELKVYDIAGRMVADLSEQISVIGHQSSVRWSGVDDANRKVGSGVYFVRLEAGEYTATQKVLLIR
jgi:hypothetical protein